VNIYNVAQNSACACLWLWE